jgi:hypothetical protein
MALAARDYLVIPASEVQVKRLSSTGRELLEIRRYSLKGETMIMLMVMDGMYRKLSRMLYWSDT